MKIPQISPEVSGQIVADSVNPATGLTTPWLLAAGAQNVLVPFEQRQLTGTGSLTGKGSYRFAAVRTDQPGAWTISTTGRTTAGEFVDSWDVSTTTDQFWVQGRYAVQQSGGIAECFAKLQLQVDGKGAVVASATVEVEPVTNSGNSSYVWLGNPFPESGLTKVMLAYVNSGQLTVTPTSGWALGQVGLKSSGDARGRVKIVVAAIY